MYDILDYSYQRAKELGVTIKPSHRKYKKIDVFRDGVRVASVGDTRYSDFPHYILSHGQSYADKRKFFYHMRHKKEGLNGFYAKYLLW